MTWSDYNVVFRKSAYEIDTIMMKNNQTWSPSGDVKKGLSDFLKTLGDSLSKATKPAPLTVKVNKGGLALRGRSALDFCWVNLKKDGFIVVWNDNLFRPPRSCVAGCDRYEKHNVVERSDLAAAVEFCLRAERAVVS